MRVEPECPAEAVSGNGKRPDFRVSAAANGRTVRPRRVEAGRLPSRDVVGFAPSRRDIVSHRCHTLKQRGPQLSGCVSYRSGPPAGAPMGNVTNLRPPRPRGQSGNPGGKSPGTRNKFSEAFFRDFYASWEKHGAPAIERVIAEDPGAYLRIVAGLMPKFDVDQPEDLTRDRIRRATALTRSDECSISLTLERHSELIRRWRPWKRLTGPQKADGKSNVARNPYEGGIRPAQRALARRFMLTGVSPATQFPSKSNRRVPDHRRADGQPLARRRGAMTDRRLRTLMSALLHGLLRKDN